VEQFTGSRPFGRSSRLEERQEPFVQPERRRTHSQDSPGVGYTGYQRPKRLEPRPKRFIPKVYFIRKVYQRPDTNRGYIDILKEQILLPKAYINMFLLAEWNLKSDRLTLYFEKNKKATSIKRLPFVLNPVVKEKVY